MDLQEALLVGGPQHGSTIAADPPLPPRIAFRLQEVESVYVLSGEFDTRTGAVIYRYVAP